MYSLSTAYLLSLLSFVGLSGVHRLYMGKVGTGILWLCTGGLLGIGTLYDLVTMPSQVREANIRKEYQDALAQGRVPRRALARESLEKSILRLAKRNGGYVTASEVALEADANIEGARQALEKLASKGFAEMKVRTNGVIVYFFAEFQREGREDFTDI